MRMGVDECGQLRAGEPGRAQHVDGVVAHPRSSAPCCSARARAHRRHDLVDLVVGQRPRGIGDDQPDRQADPMRADLLTGVAVEHAGLAHQASTGAARRGDERRRRDVVADDQRQIACGGRHAEQVLELGDPRRRRRTQRVEIDHDRGARTRHVEVAHHPRVHLAGPADDPVPGDQARLAHRMEVGRLVRLDLGVDAGDLAEGLGEADGRMDVDVRQRRAPVFLRRGPEHQRRQELALLGAAVGRRTIRAAELAQRAVHRAAGAGCAPRRAAARGASSAASRPSPRRSDWPAAPAGAGGRPRPAGAGRRRRRGRTGS